MAAPHGVPPGERVTRGAIGLALALAGGLYGYLSCFFAAAIGGALGAGHRDASLGAVPALPFAGRGGIHSPEELAAAQIAAGALWALVGLTLVAPRSRTAASIHLGLAAVHWAGLALFLPGAWPGEFPAALGGVLLAPYLLGQILLLAVLVTRGVGVVRAGRGGAGGRR